tara:strand:+ start:391 stop:864 length:474 start_codon:yes stop_codon:yes gene_type:complete
VVVVVVAPVTSMHGSPVVRVARVVVVVVVMHTRTDPVEQLHNQVRIAELLQMLVSLVVRVPPVRVTVVVVVVVLVKSEILFMVVLWVMDTIYKVVTVSTCPQLSQQHSVTPDISRVVVVPSDGTITYQVLEVPVVVVRVALVVLLIQVVVVVVEMLA